MSFVTNIKRAFGFSVEDEEEYDSSSSEFTMSDDDLHAQGIINPFRREAQPRSVETATPQPEMVDDDLAPDPATLTAGFAAGTDNDDLPGALFDAVIELFNAQAPDFVARCISTDSQRRYIYDSLDEALKGRLQAAVTVSRANPEGWTEERRALLEEIDRIKAGTKGADDLRKELKASQLSAERQKRALSDRVNDLEMKLSRSEADREQLQLENHALIAKIRSAGIVPDDVVIAGEDPRIAEKDAKIKEQGAEIERLAKQVEQLTAKSRLADTMFTDLTAQASKAKQELKEARADLEALNEISGQLDKFEEIKQKKDARIAELTADLDKSRKEVEDSERANLSLTNEIESLKKTIEANLYNQAASEKELREEIARLEALTSAEPQPEEKPQPAKRRRKNRRTRVSAIDESLDNTDWLVAPPDTPMPKDPAVKEDDFGYKEPPHKNIPDNDRQMSLW